MTGLTQLGDKVGLKFGEPSEAADQNAFAVTKAFADKYGVKTLSDLADASAAAAWSSAARRSARTARSASRAWRTSTAWRSTASPRWTPVAR